MEINDMSNNGINDNDFKIRVLNELTKLESKVERLSSHLESEVGNQERAMGRLEKAIEVVVSDMKEENQKLASFITNVHKDIFVGNGKPSVTLRIDRLEQHHQTRGRHMALLWAAVIGVIATVAGEYIINRLDKPHNQTPVTHTTKP